MYLSVELWAWVAMVLVYFVAESSSSDSSINGEPIIIVLIVWNILLTVSFIIGCVFFIRRTSHRLNGTAPDSNAEPRNLRSVPGSSHGYVVRRNFGSYPSNHHIFWDENGEDVTKPSHTEAWYRKRCYTVLQKQNSATVYLKRKLLLSFVFARHQTE